MWSSQIRIASKVVSFNVKCINFKTIHVQQERVSNEININFFWWLLRWTKLYCWLLISKWSLSPFLNCFLFAEELHNKNATLKYRFYFFFFLRYMVNKYTICHGRTSLSQDEYGIAFDTKQWRWIPTAEEALLINKNAINGKLEYLQISELNSIQEKFF